MMLFRKFHVKKDERALLFKRGDFVEILRPGEYVRFDPLGRLTLEKFGFGPVYTTSPQVQKSRTTFDIA